MNTTCQHLYNLNGKQFTCARCKLSVPLWVGAYILKTSPELLAPAARIEAAKQ